MKKAPLLSSCLLILSLLTFPVAGEVTPSPDYDLPFYKWVGSTTRDELCYYRDAICVVGTTFAVRMIKHPTAIAVISLPCTVVGGACFTAETAENYYPDCDVFLLDFWRLDIPGLGEASIDTNRISPYKIHPAAKLPPDFENSNKNISTSSLFDPEDAALREFFLHPYIPRCVSEEMMECFSNMDGDSYVDCHDICKRDNSSSCNNGCFPPTESEDCGSSSCSSATAIPTEVTKTCTLPSDRWYEFSIEGNYPVGVYLEVPDGADYDLYIMDDCGGDVLCESERGQGSSEHCYVEGSGTYYIMIEYVSGSGEYKLHIGKDNDKYGIPDFEDCDDDNDLLFDYEDNCPFHSNPSQEDEDGDGWGDSCDPLGGCDECGALVDCDYDQYCDDYHICDCGSGCSQAEEIELETKLTCPCLDKSYLDYENNEHVDSNEHAIYKVGVSNRPVAVLLNSSNEVEYFLYISNGSCSEDLLYVGDNGNTDAYTLMEPSKTYYIEIEKIFGANEPYQLYVGEDMDMDAIPDFIDDEVSVECSEADNNPEDGEVTLAEVVDYIALWDQYPELVSLSDVVDAINDWWYGCQPQLAPTLNPRYPNPKLAMAFRNVPESAPPESVFDVTLVIDVDESKTPVSIIVSEMIPIGWEVVGSSPPHAYFNPRTGEVDWLFADGIAEPVIDRIITYSMEVPEDEEVIYAKMLGRVYYQDRGVYISTPTGRSEIEVNPPECTQGACCNPAYMRFMGTDYPCDDTYEVEYGCPWGSGGDAGIRYKLRYCSGSSSGCDGVISDWQGWQIYGGCSENEYCEEGECIKGCPPGFERVDLNDDDAVDMGDLFAITKSGYWGDTCTHDCEPGFVKADLNEDGTVDMGDLFAVTRSGFWGEECHYTFPCPWDINQDRYVDITDITYVDYHFGEEGDETICTCDDEHMGDAGIPFPDECE